MLEGCSVVSVLLIYACFALTFLCCSILVVDRVKNIWGCRRACAPGAQLKTPSLCPRCGEDL